MSKSPLDVMHLATAKSAIDDTHYKISAIERKLAKAELTDEERTKQEKELEDIKSLLKVQEEALRALYKENRQTSNVALVAVVFSAVVAFFLLHYYHFV